MKKIAATVLAVAMFAMTAPMVSAGDTDVREQNREFIMDEIGDDYDPDAMVTLHYNGVTEEITQKEAVELTLDRAGDTNLETLADSAAHGEAELAGDIWLIGLGNVDCGTTTTVAPNPAGGVYPVAQFWLYNGEVGYNQGSSADLWLATSWTMKDYAAGSGGINYGGVSDFFCIEGGFFGILFPYIDGYTTTETLPAS
jgi:hypothetical protein